MCACAHNDDVDIACAVFKNSVVPLGNCFYAVPVENVQTPDNPIIYIGQSENENCYLIKHVAKMYIVATYI